MNGGVSLAVWMGGVTNEIHRLVTEGDPVYQRLLVMTDTSARVDVISGTSAGGINGAALSVATLFGGDFSKLRQVWLETGSFLDLLRSPLGENPGSLLQGDEFFLPRIEEALRSLRRRASTASPDADSTPIDLRLTTTLLSGLQGHTVDDLGSAVHDVDYRAYFHFRHKSVDDSDFGSFDEVVPKLARAARSTASFPFAFEPSLLKEDEGGAFLRSGRDEKVGMPRYVVDGGVLDNKPFQGARDAIFSMPAHKGVRRILAYINPDPGDGPPLEATGQSLPPLSKVLVEGMFGIPMSQTIADQLAAIADHNETVRTRRNSLRTLASLADATLESLASQLYAVYRARRLVSTFDAFVYEPLSIAVRRGNNKLYAKGLQALGKRGRAQLLQAFERSPDPSVGPDRTVSYGWLPMAWPAGSTDRAYAANVCWEWGLFPVEFASKVMLDLLRMSQKLHDGCRHRIPQRTIVAHATIANGVAAGVPISHAALLVSLWTDAYDILDRLEALRKHEKPRWDEGTDKLLRVLCRAVNRKDDATDPAVYEAMFEMFSFLWGADRRRRCAELVYRIARNIRAIGPLATQLAREAKTLGPVALRPLELAQADDLARLVECLCGQVGRSEEDIVFKLMQLEVVEFAFNDHELPSADTLIELVEISGNGGSPLGGREHAREKLLGLQLAHFGAFYKKSWRANDWIYGRLGGAERLIKILLNPERLDRAHLDPAQACAAIKAIALDAPDPAIRAQLEADWATEGYDASIREELAFLADPRQPLPDALPISAEAITRRLHHCILDEELGHLLDAIQSDQADGAEPTGCGKAMLLQSERLAASGVAGGIAPAQARTWLQGGLIADETLLGQAGSDLFTRTLVHTAATLQNTLASKSTDLGPITVLFASVKVPVLGFYFASRGLLAQSRTGAALNGGMLAAGIAIVLLSLLWPASGPTDKGIPGGVVAIGWALLAYGLLVAALRNAWLVGALAAMVAIVLALGIPTLSLVLFVVVVVLIGVGIFIRWFQWVAGIAMLIAIALRSSGWLSYWTGSPDQTLSIEAGYRPDVLLFAGIVGGTLLLAALQASPAGVKVDRFIQRHLSGGFRAAGAFLKRAGQAVARRFHRG